MLGDARVGLLPLPPLLSSHLTSFDHFDMHFLLFGCEIWCEVLVGPLL